MDCDTAATVLGKAPIVLFDRITSQYSYFKDEFLRQFSKALRKLKKPCFALAQFYIELKVKSLFTQTSNVLPFKFKCLTAIGCFVRLIP